MTSIAEALNQAVLLHRQGALDEAEAIYRQVLAADPRQPDAWNLLGMVAKARGDRALARHCVVRAIQLDGAQPGFHHHLAEIDRTLGHLNSAEQACRQALRIKPDQPGILNTLGLIRQQQGAHDEAADCFRRAIALDAGLAAAHANLGAALYTVGQLDEAAAACRQALTLDPKLLHAALDLAKCLRDLDDMPGAMSALRQAQTIAPESAEVDYQLGTIWQLRGKLTEAVASYRRALARDPRHAAAHCNLGSALKELGDLQAAWAEYQQAIVCDPRLAEAHFNLALCHQAAGNTAEAMRAYERAIEVRPDHAQAHNNLGTLYKMAGHWDRASECYARALEHHPNSVEALNNVGNLLKLQGRWTEAAICYDQTLRIAPDDPQAHYNRGLLLLAEGRLSEGWAEYEWRTLCPEYECRSFDRPAWTGKPLAGTLLVYAEQGLGDTLQFVRFLPQVAERARQVVCEVPAQLVPLLRQAQLSGDITWLPRGAELPQHEARISLVSLPHLLGTTLENIPLAGGYLAADPSRVAHWGSVLGETKNLRVGVAWQGSRTYSGDRQRSIPLLQFEPLAIDGVELISLQKSYGAEQLAALAGRFAVRDLGEQFDASGGAFLDTAAVMQHLDLLVASDSAIVHLAGGLGVRTWLALPLVPDWRWLLEREDSPWYRSLRLFRQSRMDDWSEVFERMAGELTLLRDSTPRA